MKILFFSVFFPPAPFLLFQCSEKRSGYENPYRIVCRRNACFADFRRYFFIRNLFCFRSRFLCFFCDRSGPYTIPDPQKNVKITENSVYFAPPFFTGKFRRQTRRGRISQKNKSAAPLLIRRRRIFDDIGQYSPIKPLFAKNHISEAQYGNINGKISN